MPAADAATPAPVAADAPPAHRGSGTPLLTLRGLSHTYAGRKVLDGLGFSVQPGEIFGLLGPNGCGKSTTLRALAGLLVPDAGELLLDGQAVAFGGRALRNRLGVVFQSPSLDQRLSVRENLELSAQLQRLPRERAAQSVKHALELAQLADRAYERVMTLSGGMKRRLELARALLHEPQLLMMDEPTTGLDEISYRRSWDELARLRASRGLTVLFTTHRAEEAALCDRVAIVDHGKLVAIDTPRALIERVSGDVLSLEASDPEGLCAELQQRLSLPAQVVDGQVLIERERGHELIPRIIEALPAGRVQALSMHRPTLADVFVKLTGHALGRDQEAS